MNPCTLIWTDLWLKSNFSGRPHNVLYVYYVHYCFPHLLPGVSTHHKHGQCVYLYLLDSDWPPRSSWLRVGGVSIPGSHNPGRQLKYNIHISSIIIRHGYHFHEMLSCELCVHSQSTTTPKVKCIWDFTLFQRQYPTIQGEKWQRIPQAWIRSHIYFI